MFTTTKNQLVDKLASFHKQKYDIEKEILQLQNQLDQINILQNQYYVGKCFKQIIENDIDIDMEKTMYYKILSVNEDSSNSFWTLVLELPMCEENLKHTTINYISKKDINFLGHNKFFLRQLTPISEEEFYKALTDVINDIKEIRTRKDNNE